MKSFTALSLALLAQASNGQPSNGQPSSRQDSPLTYGQANTGEVKASASTSEGVLSHFDPSIASWDINDFLSRNYHDDDLRYDGNKYELRDIFDLFSKISKGWRNPRLFDELLMNDHHGSTDDTTTTFVTTTYTTLATVTDAANQDNSTSPMQAFSLRPEDIAVAIEANGHLEDIVVTLESLRSSNITEVLIIQPALTKCASLPHACADRILPLISLESIARKLYKFESIKIGTYDAYLPSGSYSRRLMALEASKSNVLFIRAGQVVSVGRLLKSVAGVLESEGTATNQDVFVEIPIAASQIIYRNRGELVDRVNRSINGKAQVDGDSEAGMQPSSYMDVTLVNTSTDHVDWSQLLYCNQWPAFTGVDQVVGGAIEDPFSDSKMIALCRTAKPVRPIDRVRCQSDTVLVASRGLIAGARVLPMHSHVGERAVIGRQSPTYCITSTTDLAYQVWLDSRTRNLVNGSVDELTEQEYRQLQYYNSHLDTETTRAPSATPAKTATVSTRMSSTVPTSSETVSLSHVSDETLSVSDETLSVSNETLSVSNETLSVSNETLFVSNETPSVQRHVPSKTDSISTATAGISVGSIRVTDKSSSAMTHSRDSWHSVASVSEAGRESSSLPENQSPFTTPRPIL